jgi:predicted AAA+ superfamily ATPase
MRKRADSQKSGLAGEFFVAAELLKRDYQVSVTFGNAKSVDLFVLNERTSRTMIVQVKALRNKNYFAIEPHHIKHDLIYVFVLLNKPDEPVEFFITNGATILADLPMFFGPNYQTSKFNGIYHKTLVP